MIWWVLLLVLVSFTNTHTVQFGRATASLEVVKEYISEQKNV
jgi:hypothetical protein